MASNPEAARATLAYRRQLALIKANAIRALMNVWPDLDWVQFERIWPQWVRIAYTITAQNRAAAVQITAAYLRTFRLLEGVPGDVVPKLARTLDSAMFEIGLNATAREHLVRAALEAAREPDPRKAGLILRDARRKALDAAAGVMARHILNGGRETALQTMEADRYALGWARVTDGNPCYWCAMLASRGPVYKTRETAGANARWHDHCGCTVELVYSDAYQWPGRAEEFEQLWYEVTGPYTGQDKVRAFRRAYAERYGVVK